MSNSEILNRCLAQIASRRNRAENEAELRHKELCDSYPEFASLDRDLKSTVDKLLTVLRSNGDINEGLERIKRENLAIQKRRKDFLKSIDLTEDYLEADYVCKVCNDTGFKDNERCVCLQKLLTAAACQKLNDSSPLSLCRFDTFDLDFYEGDDKAHMENVLKFIKDYADGFNETSPSLLFYGNTGIGKTHLSLAIADTVIKKGYDVIYGQAQTLLNAVADERFSRDSYGNAESSFNECDLLIMDDLGAEFVNQVSQSVLYSIVNTRLLMGKPTIISTNIPLNQLDTVYHKRISSRLCFEFEPIPFVGKDIRQKRKRI